MERQAEPRYLPILPARPGELLALGNLDDAGAAAILPILEVPSSWRGPVRDAYLFFTRLRDRAPAGLRVAVDLRHLPDPLPSTECRRHPAYDIGEDLAAWGIPMLPVIRPFDGDHRLAGHGVAADAHGQGAVVRLRPRVTPWPAALATERMHRLWRRTGLAAGDCDLLIDLGQLDPALPLQPAVETAEQVAVWAEGAGWRSITVAAGSLPSTLARLPADRATRIARRETELARKLAGYHLRYGDYGVGSPTRRTDGRPRQPMPTVRYTTRDGTWVYRWSRHGEPHNGRFHELCRALVDGGHFAGGQFSWGDRELLRRAYYTPGPGTASHWIAWATSHHLAHVLTEDYN